MAVITAIGTAGIPGGSVPLLMMILGMVGVPMEGIAVIGMLCARPELVAVKWSA